MKPAISDAVLVLLVALAAVAVIVTVFGCGTPQDRIVQSAENAAAVAQDERLLDSCRLEGKDAGSYAVYEACANQVDSMLCRVNQLLCADGGSNAR